MSYNLNNGHIIDASNHDHSPITITRDCIITITNHELCIASWSRTALLPPPSNLGTLNCYFFIAYLGFTDKEMDFEINLFFSLTKVFGHLENFLILLYIFSINQVKKDTRHIFLSVYTLLWWKKISLSLNPFPCL